MIASRTLGLVLPLSQHFDEPTIYRAALRFRASGRLEANVSSQRGIVIDQKRLVMLTCWMVVLLTCASSVLAANIPFSYSAPGVTVRGTYATTDPVPGQVCPSGCHVLAITGGTRNEVPITLNAACTCCP